MSHNGIFLVRRNFTDEMKSDFFWFYFREDAFHVFKKLLSTIKLWRYLFPIFSSFIILIFIFRSMNHFLSKKFIMGFCISWRVYILHSVISSYYDRSLVQIIEWLSDSVSRAISYVLFHWPIFMPIPLVMINLCNQIIKSSNSAPSFSKFL